MQLCLDPRSAGHRSPILDPRRRSSMEAVALEVGGWILAGCLNYIKDAGCLVTVFVDAECWMLAGGCRMLTQEAKSPESSPTLSQPVPAEHLVLHPAAPQRASPESASPALCSLQPPPASGGRSDPHTVQRDDA